MELLFAILYGGKLFDFAAASLGDYHELRAATKTEMVISLDIFDQIAVLEE
jgi:hypothetical protein